MSSFSPKTANVSTQFILKLTAFPRPQTEALSSFSAPLHSRLRLLSRIHCPCTPEQMLRSYNNGYHTKAFFSFQQCGTSEVFQVTSFSSVHAWGLLKMKLWGAFIWCLFGSRTTGENSHLSFYSFWFIWKQKTLVFTFVLQPVSQNCCLCC